MRLSPSLRKLRNHHRIIAPFLLLPILSSSCVAIVPPPTASSVRMSSSSFSSSCTRPFSYPFINATDAAALDAELMLNPGGFSIDQLMELAGLAVATAVYKVYPLASPSSSNNNNNQASTPFPSSRSILVIAGPGNNGGDALVAARHLALWGYKPTVVYPKRPMKDGTMVPLFRNLLNQLHDLDIPVTDTLPSVMNILGNQRLQALQSSSEDKERLTMEESSSSFPVSTESFIESTQYRSGTDASISSISSSSSSSSSLGYDLILDGIFGFSFHGTIRSPFDKIIRTLSLVSEYTVVTDNNATCTVVTESSSSTETLTTNSSNPSTSLPSSPWITRSYGIPIISIDIPSGWSVDHGPSGTTVNFSSSVSSPSNPTTSPYSILYPSLLVSLTAPKPCSQYFYGPYHYLGGRFVPPKIAKKYKIDTLPSYPGCEQVVRLG